MLWKVQINRGMKFALLFVFALGGLVCLASIMRILEIEKFAGSLDILWLNKNFTIWSMAELNLGIIAGSMPALKGAPALKFITNKLGSTFSSSSRLSRGRSQKNGTHTSHQSASVLGAISPTKGFRKSGSRDLDVERYDSGVQFDDLHAQDSRAASQRNLVLGGGSFRKVSLRVWWRSRGMVGPMGRRGGSGAVRRWVCLET